MLLLSTRREDVPVAVTIASSKLHVATLRSMRRDTYVSDYRAIAESGFMVARENLIPFNQSKGSLRTG